MYTISSPKHPNETCSTLDQQSVSSRHHGEVCTSAFRDGPKRTDWAPEERCMASLWCLLLKIAIEIVSFPIDGDFP